MSASRMRNRTDVLFCCCCVSQVHAGGNERGRRGRWRSFFPALVDGTRRHHGRVGRGRRPWRRLLAALGSFEPRPQQCRPPFPLLRHALLDRIPVLIQPPPVNDLLSSAPATWFLSQKRTGSSRRSQQDTFSTSSFPFLSIYLFFFSSENVVIIMYYRLITLFWLLVVLARTQ